MRKVGLLLFLTALLAVPASAQNEYPRAELFAGYSMVNSDSTVFHGWDFSIAGNPHKVFGIVADFGGYYKTIRVLDIDVSTSTYTFGVGPQFSYRGSERVTPFARVLVGAAHFGAGAMGVTASVNAFAMAFGGGLDVKASKSVAIRVVQVEDVMTRYEGATGHDLRLSFGVVFRFGGK